jgi:hypothetical protein
LDNLSLKALDSSVSSEKAAEEAVKVNGVSDSGTSP